MKMSFYSHANKTHLHKKGFAPSLVLKVRVLETWKWPIALSQGINRCCTHSLSGCFPSSLQSHSQKRPYLNFTDYVSDQHEHSTWIYSNARHNECRPLTSSEGLGFTGLLLGSIPAALSWSSPRRVRRRSAASFPKQRLVIERRLLLQIISRVRLNSLLIYFA